MPQLSVGEKKICFVVQGFGEKTDFTDGRKLNLDASYQVIKEAVKEAGLTCLRADEIKHSGTIDQPMYERIFQADLVIADLSTYNVNAAYELGVRYGLRPHATIIVAEEKFKNPFDFSHIVIRRYKHLGEDIGVSEARRFKKELKDAITEIMAAQATDSPVYTFLTGLQPPVQEQGLSGRPQPAATVSASPATPQQPEQSVKELSDAAQAAKAKGDFMQARTLWQALRQMRPHDDFIVQQLALVTYKSKQPDQRTALEEARGILKALHPETSNDPETLGLWGAVHKRLWEVTDERMDLDASIAAYERGFYLKQDYYNGINLAFLLNVRAAQKQRAGDIAEAVADFVQARRVRREVLEICQKALDAGPRSKADKYWILATMWEASVGIEDEAAALQWGRQVAECEAAGWMRESTQTQLDKLKGLLVVSPLSHLHPQT
jgi:hypothetical protein